eukprot:TRINITY_DN9306_c0_g1_i1.p1 TRINITY_DN9306_c0_g1~~TRINITY_DN9306_c0_g1_i1.p1  ORF type:complete len:549 (-),score=86.80 TRINITY_DN9306_c0_g1_i1:379-2025(-)
MKFPKQIRVNEYHEPRSAPKPVQAPKPPAPRSISWSANVSDSSTSPHPQPVVISISSKQILSVNQVPSHRSGIPSDIELAHTSPTAEGEKCSIHHSASSVVTTTSSIAIDHVFFAESLSWKDVRGMLHLSLALLVTLFVNFAIPQYDPQEFQIYNIPFFMYQILVAIHCCSAALFYIMMASHMVSYDESCTLKLSSPLFLRCLVIMFTYALACDVCIIILFHSGIFPFPFSAVIIGSIFYYTILCPSIYLHFLAYFKDLNRYHLRKILWSSILILMLPFLVFAAEQGFVVAVYLLDGSWQLIVFTTFQALVFLSKFFQRILIRKQFKMLGLDIDMGDSFILASYAMFELILQFFVLMVSPRVADWSVIFGYLMFQSVSLCVPVVLDSLSGRNVLRRWALKALPERHHDSIEIALQMKHTYQRMLSLRVCFMNFYVRIISSLGYSMTAAFIYYGYNHDSFPTFDVDPQTIRISFLFSTISFLVAIAQFLVTRHILKILYQFDLLVVGFHSCLRNRLLLYSSMILVFCQTVIALILQQNAVEYLLDWAKH